PFAWRLSLAAAEARLGPSAALTWREETGPDPGLRRARPQTLGDLVVGRKDIGAAYALASVVDDARQGVTHVIRGTDLNDLTSSQRVLQALLGLSTPVYRHHGLITGSDGERLAKSRGSTALRDLRAKGATPRAVLAGLGL